MTRQRAALGLLALIAAIMSVNLFSAANERADAYQTYDRLGITLQGFEYRAPDQPATVTVVLTNPSGRTVQVNAIELELDAGVHNVGGGSIHPNISLAPGASQSFPMDLDISDKTYVSQLGGTPIDWHVAGRVQIDLGAGFDAEWIPI